MSEGGFILKLGAKGSAKNSVGGSLYTGIIYSPQGSFLTVKNPPSAPKEALTVIAPDEALLPPDGDGTTVAPADTPDSDIASVAFDHATYGVELIIQGLDVLAHVDAGELDKSSRMELLKELATQRIRLGAIRSDILGMVVASNNWQDGGTRTLGDFESQATQQPRDKARENVKRAQTMREDLPLFLEQAKAGRLSQEYIDPVRRAIKNPSLKSMLSDPIHGESALLQAALTMNVERFRRHVKAWSIKFAPVAEEREAAKETRCQVLNLFEKEDGWIINGYLTDKNGEMVNKILTATMGRKAKGDDREWNERRAGALLNICTKVTQYGDSQSTARVVPHLSALVDFETLVAAGMRAREAGDPATCTMSGGNGRGRADGTEGIEGIEGIDSTGGAVLDPEFGQLKSVIPSGIGARHFSGLDPAELENGTPLTPAQLQMVLCDSEIARIVLGTGSAELDVGRISRTCTPKQARAVIARDRTCRYPGCDQLYQSSNIHHVQHWRTGGNTDIDNLVMLCWYHHDKVHEGDITIEHYERGWKFIDRHGKLIPDPFDRRPDFTDQGWSMPKIGNRVA